MDEAGSVASDAAIEEIRNTILRDVDARVAERAEELWQKGKQMMSQMQLKHRENGARLQAEVQLCQDNCRLLEEQNAQLQQALTGLASRFSVLGALFSGPEAFNNAATAAAAAGGSASSPGGVVTPPGKGLPAAAVAAAALESPAQPGSAQASGDAAGGTPALRPAAGDSLDSTTAAMPPIPDFPWPSSLPPGAMFSLAEALGGQTPQRTQLSLAGLVTPPATTPAAAAQSPFPGTPAPSSGMFSFTIRKADDADLGLSVTHHEHDKVLQVEGVKEGGAVQAWNNLCEADSHKVVRSGDRIISVNKVAYDPKAMLEECQSKQLLKLTVVRDGWPLPTPPAAATAKASSQPAQLSANASVFVPRDAVDASKI